MVVVGGVVCIIVVTCGTGVAHNDFISTGETVTIGVTEFGLGPMVLCITISLISTLCG